jgi:hypothetical protein
LVFFGWFVAVFIWLATRALPSGGNLLKEFILIVKDSVSKFIRIFVPDSK